MTNRLRTGFALLTLVGAFHLRGAQAAQPEDYSECSDYARGYAAGYCDATTGGAWMLVSYNYSCNADGTATVSNINCT